MQIDVIILSHRPMPYLLTQLHFVAATSYRCFQSADGIHKNSVVFQRIRYKFPSRIHHRRESKKWIALDLNLCQPTTYKNVP